MADAPDDFRNYLVRIRKFWLLVVVIACRPLAASPPPRSDEDDDAPSMYTLF